MDPPILLPLRQQCLHAHAMSSITSLLLPPLGSSNLTHHCQPLTTASALPELSPIISRPSVVKAERIGEEVSPFIFLVRVYNINPALLIPWHAATAQTPIIDFPSSLLRIFFPPLSNRVSSPIAPLSPHYQSPHTARNAKQYNEDLLGIKA